MSDHWVPSRFTRIVRIDGKGRMLYNTYTGAMAAVPPEEEAEACRLLEGREATAASAGLAAELREAGFLVPAMTDELRQAQQLHDAQKEAASMHLVIMPTEACNFRCTYCYQSFPRGAMGRETIDGLKAYVREAAARIDHLSVSWFGGEPLLVPGTIDELSDCFMESCSRNGAGYSADMSTNGYYLTKERMRQLLDRNITRYMVTLDGTAAVHDQRRRLLGGGKTYETTIGNLLELRSLDASFTMDLRVNFDADNVEEVPGFLKRLSEWFGGDSRFQLLVRPIGRWGGPQDDRIPVCDRTASDKHLWEMMDYGLEQGLAVSETIADALMPSGSVCYAAKPNSLVIGADGQLYKCSVAFDDEMNRVGRLSTDGRMELDMDKLSLWTSSGEDKDAVCRSCFFRPACQGNHCPLYRMRTGKRPCPHEKRKMKRVLSLLWKQADRYKGGESGDEAH